MDLMRQKRVEAVFMEAIAAREGGIDGEGVRALVGERCGDDHGLRAEVESLLAAHEREEGLLDRGNPLIAGTIPGRMIGEGASTDEGPVQPGQRIGHYTVARVLGSGGMGVVYVAEQERPRRTVALKVIRPSVTSAAMLRRFEHEAEVLGRLHHPGIAQIYEAGTAEIAHPRTGAPMRVPYLAMELVDGPSLIDYAEAHALNVREKLELIRLVCQAVQHAHQKGVIHRDLKPSNILVAEGGERRTEPGAGTGPRTGASSAQPKVLDFGVARVTDSDLRVTTLQTSVGQLIGTLPYMSPEQVAGDPDAVDTRSDVYALGVVLYQLLTGRLPHDVSSRSVPEAARMIRDEHPSRLSVIDRTFRGEVDTIVAKAMEKDRSRRYQSAEELGEDLRRYLAGEAIQARRDSAMYVLRKQLRRYKWAVSAAAVFMLLVLAFGVFAWVQASRQRTLAQALSYELSCSNIERGRALGYAGSHLAAETTLWSELFRDPSSKLAHWALWEYYARRPVLKSVTHGGFTGTSLTTSADGRAIALRGMSNRTQVWDGGMERMLQEIPPPEGVDPSGFALTPDGRSLLIVGSDGIIRQYEVASGQLQRSWGGCPDRPRSLAVLADNQTIVCGSRGGWLTVWAGGSVENGRDIRAHGNTEVWNLAPSPDGRYVATSSRDRTVRIWDTQNWEPVQTIEGFGSPVFAMRFLPDSQSLLVGGDGGHVSLYRVGSDTPEWSVPTACAMPYWIALGPPDEHGAPTTFACGGEGSLELFDLGSRRLISRLAHRDSGTYSVAISPIDGSIIAAGGGAVVRVWEDQPFKGMRTLDATGSRITAMAMSPDGRWLVGHDMKPATRIWDLQTGASTVLINDLRKLPGRAVAFSPDGELLAIGLKDERVELRRGRDWVEDRTLVLPAASPVTGLAFTPAADRVICGTSNGDLCVVDLVNDHAMAIVAGSGTSINGLNVSPDGRWLAVTGQKPALRVLELPSLDEVFASSTAGYGWSAAFDASGSTLAFATGSTIELLRPESWTRRAVLEGHSDSVADVKFSPKGDLLASCGGDQTVRLWDPVEGRHLATLDAPGADLLDLAFSPDGTRLYASRADGQIVEWDLTYYDRHIAGNLEYMIERRRDGHPDDRAVRQLRAWAAAVAARAGSEPGASRRDRE